MKQELISVLESFGYPVYLQGSMNIDDAYPDSFFTFWNNSSDETAHYDNDASAFVWDFDVNFYSSDPALVNTVPVTARKRLKAAGFIVRGKGHDVLSDEITHTGRGLDVYYREENTPPDPPGPEPEPSPEDDEDENEETDGDTANN